MTSTISGQWNGPPVIHEAAINSLSIVFAADASIRSGEVVRL